MYHASVSITSRDGSHAPACGWRTINVFTCRASRSNAVLRSPRSAAQSEIGPSGPKGWAHPSGESSATGATVRRETAANRPHARLLAEGVGFEPTRDLTAPNGFRDRPVQPLRHPSGTWKRLAAQAAYSSLALSRLAASRSNDPARGKELAGRFRVLSDLNLPPRARWSLRVRTGSVECRSRGSS